MGERAKTTTVVAVYDFINSLQLLWWLCDAEDWQRERIRVSISILTHVVLISWVFFLIRAVSVFWNGTKAKMQCQTLYILQCQSWMILKEVNSESAAKTIVRGVNHAVLVSRFWQLWWHIFCFRLRGQRAADLLQQVWLWVLVLAVQPDLNQTTSFNRRFNLI